MAGTATECAEIEKTAGERKGVRTSGEITLTIYRLEEFWPPEMSLKFLEGQPLRLSETRHCGEGMKVEGTEGVNHKHI